MYNALTMSAKTATIELPANIRLVKEPTVLPPRIRAGKYRDVMEQVIKLTKTSIEIGLSPHLEWTCKDQGELNSTMANLYGLRRRHRDRFGSVALRQQADADRKRFIVYLWNQE
jgi:hypothetical protein